MSVRRWCVSSLTLVPAAPNLHLDRPPCFLDQRRLAVGLSLHDGSGRLAA